MPGEHGPKRRPAKRRGLERARAALDRGSATPRAARASCADRRARALAGVETWPCLSAARHRRSSPPTSKGCLSFSGGSKRAVASRRLFREKQQWVGVVVERGPARARTDFTPGHHAEPRCLGCDPGAQLLVLLHRVQLAEERKCSRRALESQHGPGLASRKPGRQSPGHLLSAVQYLLDGPVLQHDTRPLGYRG